MPTIADLNKRYGTTGVSNTPASGGNAFTIADLNTFNAQKSKEDEEERKRKAEEERRNQEQKAQEVKAANPYSPKEQIPPHPREAEKAKQLQLNKVLTENTTISQAPEKKKGILNSIAKFFGFGDEEFTTADTIKLQQDAFDEKKKEEIKGLAKDLPSNFTQFGGGVLSAQSVLQSTSAAVARKLGAEEIAKKLDIDAAENRDLKRQFDQEYRQLFVDDKYSMKEKLMAAPVRYISGLVADTAPMSLGILAGGAAATTATALAGAPVAATVAAGTAASFGLGALFSFGSAYQEAREFGVDEKESEKIGALVAITTAPFEALPQVRLLGKIAGGDAIKRQIAQSFSRNVARVLMSGTKGFAIQGMSEGSTEVIQTVVENAWAKTYDENRNLFAGIPEAGLAGFFSGGALDTMVSGSVQMHSSINNLTENGVIEGPNGMIYEEQEPDVIEFQPKVPKTIEELEVEKTVEASPVKQEVTTTGVKVDENLLFQEARKYKSAEEFVKAQGTPVYHGTNAKFEVFDPKKIGSATDDGMWGKGFYFRNTESFARVAPRGTLAKNVMEVYPKSRNFFDVSKVKSVDEMAKVLDMSPDSFVQETSGLIRPLQQAVPSFTSKVQGLGYDGVVVKRGGDAIETVIFDPKNIQTKSQLTDIYNQATQQVEQKKVTKGNMESRVYARLKEEHSEVLNDDVSYDAINLKKDAQKAVALINKDPAKGYKVAMGMQKPPVGQTATGINIAMAEKALEEGNTTLYSQLVKKRSLDQTRRGQEIVAEKGSVTDNSTSRYVKELISIKLDSLGNKYMSQATDKVTKRSNKIRAMEVLDKEVAKAQKKISGKMLDIKQAQSFLDALSC